VELAEIGDHRGGESDASISLERLVRVIADRDVLLLAVSYLCMNYVFYLLANWVFLYLIQERHFSVLESGWLATIPPLAAALGSGLGGVLAVGQCRRHGIRWGFRAVPLVALPASGLLLFAAVHAGSAYIAVAALALCYGSVELTEASYWSAAMTVGRRDTMAACGLMNTGGNLGGIVGIPIVAYLSQHQAWNAAFFVGIGFALASALAWLGIDAQRAPGRTTGK
jgi:ACS family glucarate transporter-like MFS transporter